MLNKEIDRLKKLNKYLYMASAKRDQILNSTIEENRKLSEKVKNFEQN